MKKIFTRIHSRVVLAIAAALVSTAAFAQTDVLVCGAVGDTTYINDVQAKLIATGNFSSVQIYNTYLGVPTMADFQGYEAILLFTDNGPVDATALGDTVAAYIEAGGGVVNCVFANASVPVGGRFDSLYQVVVWDDQSGDTVLTLGTILVPCHPIITGITNLNGGTSSYVSTSSTLTAGSQFIADWNTGKWLAAAKDHVGPGDARRADLNLYPPSSDARPDFWDASTQGADLMANALLWVAHVTNGIGTPGQITGASAVCTGDGGTYSILPVSGATSYTWSVPAGTVIQNGQGTTSINVIAGSTSGNIIVTATDSCMTSDSSLFFINVSNCTGIQSLNAGMSVGIYPNPTSSVCTISIANTAVSSTLIEISDLQGKIVYSENVQVNGSFTKQLDLSTLANGAYFLRVTAGNELHVQKIFRN